MIECGQASPSGITMNPRFEPGVSMLSTRPGVTLGESVRLVSTARIRQWARPMAAAGTLVRKT